MKEIDKLEDTKNKFLYEDILYLEHPTSKKHPRQSLENRAGQFSPFAALTGYEEQVKEVSRITSQRKNLTEEEKDKLDQIIRQLMQNQNQKIKITYFEKDKRKEGGKYLEIKGYLKKWDQVKKSIILKGEYKILIKDIVKIEIITTQE